jgi:anti-sigma B factor antagonist
MEVKIENDTAIACIVRRFDAYTASEVEAALREAIAKGAKKIVCDFTQTEYVASAGLRVLLSQAKNLQKTGGQIVMASMQPYVYEVFEISGFNQIFKVYKSNQEAIEALKK